MDTELFLGKSKVMDSRSFITSENENIIRITRGGEIVIYKLIFEKNTNNETKLEVSTKKEETTNTLTVDVKIANIKFGGIVPPLGLVKFDNGDRLLLHVYVKELLDATQPIREVTYTAYVEASDG